MAGLQMEFEESVDDGYTIIEKDAYKFSISNELLKDTDYLELKYSDNFLAKGFYVSNKKK